MDSLVNATSGGVASLFSTSILYPLDVLLVRYQTASSEVSRIELKDIILDALRMGPTKLYNGLRWKLCESFLKNFIYFYWYDLLKRLYTKKLGTPNTLNNLGLASLAGVMNQLIIAPLEVVTSSIQSCGPETEESAMAIVWKIFQQSGIRGFYRGFTASIILCSNPAITNTTFDKLKFLFQNYKIDQIRRWKLQQKKKITPTPPTNVLENIPTINPISKQQELSFIINGLPAQTETLGNLVSFSRPLPFSSDETTLSNSLPVLNPDKIINGSIPSLSSLESFVLGAISKSLATVVTYPYIRAKTLLQTSIWNAYPTDEPKIDKLKRKESGLTSKGENRRPHSSESIPDISIDSPSNDVHATQSTPNVPSATTTATHQSSAPHTQNIASTAFSKNYSLTHMDSLPDIHAVNSKIMADGNSNNSYFRVSSFCLSDNEQQEKNIVPHILSTSPRKSINYNRYNIEPVANVRRQQEITTVGVLVSVIMREGFPGLYKGLWLQLCKTVLSSALMYMMKEKIEITTRSVLFQLQRFFFSIYKSYQSPR